MISRRIAAARAQVTDIGRDLVDGGRGLSSDDAFELAGELQGLVNASEGAQGVVAAWGARVETTMYESRPWERTHPVGFVDAMAPAQMSLATALTEGVAGRKVALGAELAARFPRLRDLVLAGDLPAASAHKVVEACAGLDDAACERVDARLAPRLVGMDPARVMGAARAVAHEVAADQVAAQQARTRLGRTVRVSPGDDGLTQWWALLPAETSAAMWSAVELVADDYRNDDPALTVDEARADALGDLVLRGVDVDASVTLGIPVVTGSATAAATATSDGPPSGEASDAGGRRPRRQRVDPSDDDTVVDAATGEVTRFADLTEATREELSWVEFPADDTTPDARFTEQSVVSPGLAVSGCDLPGVGYVPADVMAGLLRTLPLAVTRAVLEAGTGTLVSVTADAYTPPRALREFVTARDGTCRMWGCTRRADHVDLDHTRPWPTGPTSPTNLAGLCRRHHRMKQQGRWRYRLAPDGTVTWIGPGGQVRVTEPAHRTIPPPPPSESRSASPALLEAIPPPF